MDIWFTEQLKEVLYSTNTEKASAVFLEILQSPQCSSLTLHPVMWKILVDITISSPPLCSSAMGLELELMKILARCSTTSENEDPTTMDNVTDEMRGYICNKLLACWGYDRPSSIPHLGIMLSLIPRIHQRLVYSSHASDRKEVIETALAIINGTALVIRPSLLERLRADVLDPFTTLFSLLSSEFRTSDVDVEVFARGISTIFNPHQSQWIQSVLRCCDLDQQQRLLSQAGSDADSRLHNGFIPDLSAMVKIWHMGINILVDFMLLLIDRRHERILYAFVEGHSIAYWQVCISQLNRWTSGEQFRQWTFLKRVLAIVVIRKLQRYTDDDEPLPQYDYEAHTEVDRFPWLLDIYSPGSSR